MKLKTMAVVPFLAVACLAEVGPTATATFPAAQRVGPTTCVVAAPATCNGAECPKCVVDTAERRDTVRLHFPPDKKTCVELVTEAPDNIDRANPLTLRFRQTRVGGHPGTSAGGVCDGECAKLTAQLQYLPEGTALASFPYTGTTYVSDNLPGGGPNAVGKKITGAIRDIDMLAAGVTRRDGVAIRFCRDARPWNTVGDNQSGTVAVEEWYIVWPTVQSPTAP